MSIQLNPDEMLEALSGFATDEATPPHPRFDEFRDRLESLASEMAGALAASLGVNCGDASFEGLAFAGTCAPFQPRTHRQPCPDVLAMLDPGAVADWNEQAAELPATE